MIQDYCAGFLISTDLDNVVMIVKQNPPIMNGKLNAVGGK